MWLSVTQPTEEFLEGCNFLYDTIPYHIIPIMPVFCRGHALCGALEGPAPSPVKLEQTVRVKDCKDLKIGLEMITKDLNLNSNNEI